MLAIEHHIVKSGEAHDLDQCRVARETLHAQRELTVIDHFLYAVLLVHRSTSLSLSCVVPSGHLTYGFAGGVPKYGIGKNHPCHTPPTPGKTSLNASLPHKCNHYHSH